MRYLMPLFIATLTFSLPLSEALAYPDYQSVPKSESGHQYMRLHHRSIIYFAPSKDTQVDTFLLGTFTNDCALKERDVVSMVVTKEGFSYPDWVGSIFDYATLSSFFNIKDGSHAAILIGKDGEEKRRWTDKIDWIQLQKHIDEMPLRQQESRLTKTRCSI